MDTLQFGWLSQGSFGRQQRVRGFERETGIPGVGQMGTAVGRRREDLRADVTSNGSSSAGGNQGEKYNWGVAPQEVKLYQE